ncbi:MAG: hypothetical protein ACK4F7_01900 [Inhella sp.]
MNAPSLESVVEAVLAWQHRQPLAERLSAQGVHSIGLVALPFVRSADDATPVRGLRQRLARWLGRGDPSGARAAFSERFIRGLSTRQAAAFALRHGVESVEGADDWPQRRIEVDDRAASAGGWPFERWLLSAAIEGSSGRQRVLISLEPPLQVAGRRLLDRKRLLLLALVLLLPLAGLAWWLRGEARPPAPLPNVSVSGAVQTSSAVASAAVTASAPIAATASAAASGMAAAASAAPLPPTEPASEPSPDIRPRLGPVRRRAEPASDAVITPIPKASGPTIGTAAPERVAPRLPSSGPVVALVSPVFAKREEAEAMLERMRSHAAQAGATGLDGGIFDAKPGGYRAAVWPFASREEAQLINATMVARGWRTRAMDF